MTQVKGPASEDRPQVPPTGDRQAARLAVVQLVVDRLVADHLAAVRLVWEAATAGAAVPLAGAARAAMPDTPTRGTSPATITAMREEEKVDQPKPNETFNVVQFFANDSYEYVRRRVTPLEATVAAHHYCSSVGARLGIVNRVIITDSGDLTCFEWIYGKGIVFPRPEKLHGKPAKQ